MSTKLHKTEGGFNWNTNDSQWKQRQKMKKKTRKKIPLKESKNSRFHVILKGETTKNLTFPNNCKQKIQVQMRSS